MYFGYRKKFAALLITQSIIVVFVCFELYSMSNKNRQGADNQIHRGHSELKFSGVKLNQTNVGMLDDSENGDSESNEIISPSIYRDINSKNQDMNNPDNVNRHLSNMTEAYGDVCQPKIPQLSQIQRPKIALASFMGSGNTWTRHLIQQMSGIGTSAVYCDKSLRLNGFPYECYKDRTRVAVVKTHRARNPNMFDRAVLLLRNPFDAFISATNWRLAGHLKHASDEIIRAEVEKNLDHSIRTYKGMVRAFVEHFKGPVFILQYERLQSDLTNTLTELAAFLELDVTSRDIECTVHLQNGNFHRPTDTEARKKLLHEIYDSEKEEKIRYAMIEVDAVIHKRFYKQYKTIKSLQQLFDAEKRANTRNK